MPWIEGPDALVACVLDALRDADGGTWAQFTATVQEFVRRGQEVFKNDPGRGRRSPPVSARDKVLLDQRRSAAWDVVSATRAARSPAHDALERVFHDAFRSGCILVFEVREWGLESRPPDLWADGPPFRAGNHTGFPDFELKRIERTDAASSLQMIPWPAAWRSISRPVEPAWEDAMRGARAGSQSDHRSRSTSIS